MSLYLKSLGIDSVKDKVLYDGFQEILVLEYTRFENTHAANHAQEYLK